MKYIALIVALFSASLLAQNQAPQGWRWYAEPIKKIKPKQPPKTQTTSAVTRQTLSATEQMNWFHAYYAEVKNDAVLHPKDLKKLERLMMLNQFMTQQATQLALTSQKALLDVPSLKYTTHHPTQHAAREPYLRQQRQQKEQEIQHLAEQGYGLFFVYEGQDPIAQKLAPSIQDFAQRHQLHILGVSLDGVLSDTFSDNKVNHGQLHLADSPAVVLVHPKRGEMIPIVYGWVTQEELLNHIHQVYNDFTPDF